MAIKVKLLHLIKSRSSELPVSKRKKKSKASSKKDLSYDSLSSLNSNIAGQSSSNCVVIENEINESFGNNFYSRGNRHKTFMARKYDLRTFRKSPAKIKDNKSNKPKSLFIETNGTGMNINNTTSLDINQDNCFSTQYSFYSYFYPSETDEGLLPFAKTQLKSTIDEKTFSSTSDEHLKTIESSFYKTDRRLKMIENKCEVEVKIGGIEEKLIRGLPRRKVTIFSHSYEKIATALSCIENAIPELLEKALFTEPLNCDTHNWPTASGIFIRQLRKSKYFHKRALNCPLGSSSWSKVIDPKKIFPCKTTSLSMRTSVIQNTNKITSKNNVSPIIIEHEIIKENQTDQTTDSITKSLSSSYMKKFVIPNDLKENKNNNKLEDSEFLDFAEASIVKNQNYIKYLKFPFTRECGELFKYNENGVPINNKFQNYLKMSKCEVLNMKFHADEMGKMFYYVKIFYQNPSQLVKLFLLLKFKIKY